jgi:molybdopterin-guanine dinucleotide biosynthesis protein A
MFTWTAIVLTGGGSRRLGQDKASVQVSGRRMIDRVLQQIPADVPVVVVGPDPHVDRRVTLTREDPPGGGPAAAIGAAVRLTTTDLVAVIATDMPFAVPALRQLLAVPDDVDAVVPLADGHLQPLAAVYRTHALRDIDVRPGMSMRDLLAGLRVELRDSDPALFVDIDTPADLAHVRGRLTIMESEDKGSTMQEWVVAVKEALGLDTEVDVDLILDVAKDAAHGVQRPAAPVSTYLLGLAVAGGADPAQAAATVQKLANSWPTPDA